MSGKLSCRAVRVLHREGDRALNAGVANCNLPGRIPLKRKLSAIELFDLLWPEEKAIWLTTINSCENILH